MVYGEVEQVAVLGVVDLEEQQQDPRPQGGWGRKKEKEDDAWNLHVRQIDGMTRSEYTNCNRVYQKL